MKLSNLPSVHELLLSLGDEASRFPHRLVVNEARAAIEQARERLREGKVVDLDSVAARVRQALFGYERASPRPVINATGVVLHTNLGRAPVAGEGYSDLEYDLATGKRGRRDAHTDRLFGRLLEAPGIVVNNNAAAVYLVLRALAAEREVIVSRGELVEIGESFRIPDIMREAGAVLREVGSTNRTNISDYANAINPNTALLMIVHPSNFRVEGFTAKPDRRELAALGRARGIPVYEDLGSGCFVDLAAQGIDEPRVPAALREGVPLVSFSGDKLLGGPQAGIVAGERDLVERLRRHPMYRALRAGKLVVSQLEATLRATLLERWDEIPALRMIRATSGELRARATRLATAIGGTVHEGQSVIGGGSTPEQFLPAWLVWLTHPDVTAIERRLRQGEPPVVARIEDGRLVLDPRTVGQAEEAALIEAVKRALAA